MDDDQTPDAAAEHPEADTASGRPRPWGLIASIVAAVVIVAGAIVVAAGLGTESEPSAASGAPDEATATENPLERVSEVVGGPAPDVAYETFDGGTAQFSDYLGTPVVVNFFSSICAPCLQEMPDFERVKQAHEGEVVFLGMNVTDSVKNGLAVVERTGVTWDLGRDPTGEILSSIGGIGMPTTMIIAADGTVTYARTGQLSEAELEEHLADAMGSSG